MRIKMTAALLGAAALAVLANPAMAAGPIKIDVGANTTGVHNWTAVAKAPGIDFDVYHNGVPVSMGCSTATATGTVTAGTTTTGLNVGRITGTTWGTKPTPYAPCVGPGGIDMNVTQIGNWALNFDLTPKPTAPIADVIAGQITGVSAHVASKIPGLCEFDVTGSADMAFHERKLKSAGPPAVYAQALVVNETSGNLIVDNVVGCFGAITNGDEAHFQGEYNVTSPDGLINAKP
ncbi:hypothetical protein [Aeromicrobium sp. UC242_57]|uniref:hypothetical protein n=1 Tax=Aeromicrobium sp. UC242_57 TaxID=3374624 RepID=UPI0037B14109